MKGYGDKEADTYCALRRQIIVSMMFIPLLKSKIYTYVIRTVTYNNIFLSLRLKRMVSCERRGKKSNIMYDSSWVYKSSRDRDRIENIHAWHGGYMEK